MPNFFRRPLLAALAAMAVSVAAPAARAQAPADSPALGDSRVLLRTNRGDIVLGLFAQVAPKHTAQVLRLARLGVYDSTVFHRIEPGYVVQLSDAQNRKLPLTPEQRGALARLPAEFSTVRHQPGSLSMARQSDDPNSAESSFSILLAPAPHLDGKYTVFGRVEWGMPLVSLVASEPRDAKSAPTHPFIVESATVKSAAEIERLIAAGQLRQAVRVAASPPAAPSAIPPSAVPASTPGPARSAEVPVAQPTRSPLTSASLILIGMALALAGVGFVKLLRPFLSARQPARRPSK